MIRLRDRGVCRTPWCDAPIRHSDHVQPWHDGGETSLNNSAGQCVRCNQSKEARGHVARVKTNPSTKLQEISYIEPDGQIANSIPPPLPTPATMEGPASVVMPL